MTITLVRTRRGQPLPRRARDATLVVDDLAHAQQRRRERSCSRPSRVTRRVSRWAGTSTRRGARRTRRRPSTGCRRSRSCSSRPSPSSETTEERAPEVADATEHRGGERLDAEQEADVVARLVVDDREHDRRAARHEAAEEEGDHDHLVDVDAHEREPSRHLARPHGCRGRCGCGSRTWSSRSSSRWRAR